MSENFPNWRRKQILSSSKSCKPEGSGMVHLKFWKEKIYNNDTLLSKIIIQNWSRYSFPDMPKLKEFITTKSALQKYVRVLFK